MLALPGLASLHPHPLPPLHPHAPWGPSEALLQLTLFQVCSLLLPQAAGLLSSRGLTLHTPCTSSHCTHLSEISTGSGLASLTPSPNSVASFLTDLSLLSHPFHSYCLCTRWVNLSAH